MSKYKICLEIDNLDNFVTVMKVVEGNKGIRVTEAGLPFGPVGSNKNQIKRYRNPEGSSHSLLMQYFKDNKMKEVSLTNLKNWFESQGYRPNSCWATIGKLIELKKLKKHPTNSTLYVVL